MAEWWLRFLDGQTGNRLGEYSAQTPTAEIRNSEPGGISCEIALGQLKRNSTQGIRRDEFAPYAANYELYRGNMAKPISDGMVTSVNLNGDRDTILVSGKDWKHYLQRRIYPFSPEDYVTYDEQTKYSYWDTWPKKWVGPAGQEVTVNRMVRDLLLSMRKGVPIDYPLVTKYGFGTIDNLPNARGTPQITWNMDQTKGPTGRYKIFPGDQTTIYDHIQKLSELNDGFEWDILPGSMEFRMWQPTKYSTDVPVYSFTTSDDEADGAIIDFDWTNDGPDGTYLLGLGSGRHKIGATWTYVPSLDQYGRLDLVYDYGEFQNYAMILRKLKDQNDLHPQKKLSLVLSNPEFLGLNFYTGDRPRSLVANTVRVTHYFNPYHMVDAYFQVNAIKWSVDNSTNENVELELMMVYEPDGIGA